MVMQRRRTTRPMGDGYDAILEPKRKCHFQFFHGSQFLLQASTSQERSFIFKMSTTGPGSGVDVVRRMDRDGHEDL
ncbi:hypothetical protein GOP47_0016266 [Adiantum capillus-veneris]|uniref:Uncharacterized protein n=1 Tax=Adiantum capillus-veneris TaxID=13818 RepID=A0A9D4UIF3_ADICA|nr:hypothetical protein GOP47_0016266 [Adiantum capillus-veneris]